MVLWLAAFTACDRRNEPLVPCPKPAFTLRPSADTLSVGDTVRFAAVLPGGGTAARLRWSSLASQVATVDANGLATARAPGVAGIEALDLDSPVNCPDVWIGQVLVR
jgi:uncharacterized protein YjdB